MQEQKGALFSIGHYFANLFHIEIEVREKALSVNTFVKKRILLVLTGGTVAGHVAQSAISGNQKSDPESFLTALQHSIEILKRNWGVEVEPQILELFDVDSSNMLPENWTRLITEIENNYDAFDAFIVLHGTNTMGYTAAALSFAFENINKPIIITGAQVPLGYLGSDATTNLVNALRISVWGYHPIKGVLAVFGSKVISGVRVKKGSDFDYDPFKSFHSGSVAQIGRYIKIDELALDTHVSYLSRSKPLAIQSRVLSVKKDFRVERIASLTEFPGMNSSLFQQLVEHSGIEGFILRAFGAGDASGHLFEALEYLKRRRIPLVVTSQAPSGVASLQVNETGQHIREHELGIPAYDMSIETITVKLGWLLAQGFSYEEIQSHMVRNLRGEINVEQELL